jgi:hypothetical protein
MQSGLDRRWQSSHIPFGSPQAIPPYFFKEAYEGKR